jgi:hypothetical protein
MATEKSQKIPQICECKICDYSTYSKKDLNKHLLTSKHANATLCYKNATYPHAQQQMHESSYICECGRNFKHHSSLYRHKHKCTFNHQQLSLEINDTSTNTDLITYLMNENKELKNMIMDVCKNNSSTNISNSNITTNSHNKTFNMNVFLNEHCKDAMNISEFVDSIQLGFNDLVNVGKVGYVEGISSIIINKLRSLDIHKRPMHCGDEKRHSMYIKEDGKWEKQPEDNNRVRKLIKQVAFKNTKNTVLFKEKYPDCGTSASKYSDQYNKIVMESFGGRGASDEEKENKIVRMIAKEVYIDKTL